MGRVDEALRRANESLNTSALNAPLAPVEPTVAAFGVDEFTD